MRLMMTRLIVKDLDMDQISMLNDALSPKTTKYSPHEPHPKQKAYLLLKCKEAFYGGAAGGGKVLSNEGIILTPFGWKKGKDLQVGDLVNNPKGSIQKVIQIKPEVTLPKWRVHFSDGTFTDVAEDHLWLAWRARKSIKIKNKRVNGKKSAKVIETRTLKEWLNRGYNPQIPVCEEQSFNRTTKEKNKLNPYLLGLLLGDGCLTGDNINITCNHEDREFYLEKFPKDSNKVSNKTLRFTGEFNKYIVKKLKLHKLLGCKSDSKFIPDIYKYSSIEDRYSIIQGLMDTDGYNDKKKNGCYYYTISNKLAKDVAFILRSLGAVVTITSKIGKYKDNNGTIIQCNKCYCLYIKHRNKNKLFSLNRKKSHKVEINISKKVTKVEICGEITGRCITVDNPNGLYITNDFIVTHNSDALLMAALQYVDVPNYSAIIFRRTFQELSLSGALMSRAHEWLYPYRKDKEVHWSENTKTYTFNKTGATITFGYLEHPNDKYRYQSSEFQFIGFDELTEFDEESFKFLFSRLRRLSESKIPLRVRAASNPGGLGHDWVKERYLIEGPSKGRIFIPASLGDNPSLDKEGYIDSLQELDPVTRAQLMEGNWEIKHGGNMFKSDWFEIISKNELPEGYRNRVRYWDLAATDPTKRKKKSSYKPAYTVGLLLSEHKGTYYIEDVVRLQKRSKEIESVVKSTAEMDGKYVDIWMEEEPGSAGKNNTEHYGNDVLKGYTFRSQKESGSKVLRANPVSAAAERGQVKLVRGRWNKPLLEELELFPDGRYKDQADALSGAYDKLHTRPNYRLAPTDVGEELSYWQVV